MRAITSFLFKVLNFAYPWALPKNVIIAFFVSVNIQKIVEYRRIHIFCLKESCYLPFYLALRDDSTTHPLSLAATQLSANSMLQTWRITSICVRDTIKYTTGILTLLASTSIRDATGKFLINQGWTSVCPLLGVRSLGETIKDVRVCLSSDIFYLYIYSE